MARLEPLTLAEVPDELRPVFDYAGELMGFTANDVLTMARWPALLKAMQQLVGVIYGPGELEDGLKRLVAMVVSSAAGCRYCQAHTAHGSSKLRGMTAAKIAAVWEFETSELFDERERAALRVARGAGQVPNAVTDGEFADLRRHFGDQEVPEIMGIIGLFGFLNRWNDTLATELEATPLGFARDTLPAGSWEPGKHVSDPD
jgi:uncharacterized peroxidase-related enzyme